MMTLEKPTNTERMSPVRRMYFVKLWARVTLFAVCIFLYAVKRPLFDVIKGMNFFSGFSVLHILWLLWVLDMLMQLIPVRAHISLGSHKIFKNRFRPLKGKINRQKLREYVVGTTKAAYKVMILWVLLILLIGALHKTGLIDSGAVLLISVCFFVCDLICVLIWCPFRLIMKNRCCTTCRIFNWDHLMMFSPLAFVPGFYTYSLLGLSVIVWLLWELCVVLYPERFWENSNMALRCSECTDKLCTQYCRKLRNEK